MQAGLPRRVVWPRMQSELLSKVQVLSMEKRQREQNPKVIYLFIYLSIYPQCLGQYATYTTWQKITYLVIIFEVLYELTYSHRHIFNSAAKALLKEVKIHGLPRRGGNLISWADCISPSINAKRRGLFVYSVELGVGVFPAQPLTFCTYVLWFLQQTTETNVTKHSQAGDRWRHNISQHCQTRGAGHATSATKLCWVPPLLCCEFKACSDQDQNDPRKTY